MRRAEVGQHVHIAPRPALLAVNQPEFRDLRPGLPVMRAFAGTRPGEAIVQQAVGHIPLSCNIVPLTRLRDADQRLAYAAAKRGQSSNVAGANPPASITLRTAMSASLKYKPRQQCLPTHTEIKS